MDRIFIKELEIFAHHGVYDDEKEKTVKGRIPWTLNSFNHLLRL